MYPLHRYLISLLLLIAVNAFAHDSDKIILGDYTDAYLDQSPIRFLARVSADTPLSQVNGKILSIDNGSRKKAQNVGKKATIKLINRDGKSFEYTTEIRQLTQLSEGKGPSYYVIAIPVTVKGVQKFAEVAITDRTGDKTSMVLGRNIISGDFLVDIDR